MPIEQNWTFLMKIITILEKKSKKHETQNLLNLLQGSRGSSPLQLATQVRLEITSGHCNDHVESLLGFSVTDFFLTTFFLFINQANFDQFFASSDQQFAALVTNSECTHLQFVADCSFWYAVQIELCVKKMYFIMTETSQYCELGTERGIVPSRWYFFTECSFNTDQNPYPECLKWWHLHQNVIIIIFIIILFFCTDTRNVQTDHHGYRHGRRQFWSPEQTPDRDRDGDHQRSWCQR